MIALIGCIFLLGCNGSSQTSVEKQKSDSTQGTGDTPAETVKRKPNAKWAQQLFDQNEFDKAFEEASQVLLSEPTNAQALLVMASVLYKKGDVLQAIETIQSIRENDLLYGIPSRVLMAQWMLADDRWEDADKVLGQLVRQKQASRDIKQLCITLLNASGRRYEANDLIVEFLAMGEVTRDQLILLLDPSEPIDARKQASQVLAKNPNDSIALLSNASYAMFLQDYDTAIDGFKGVLAKRSDIPSANASLALIFARTERWNECAATLSSLQGDALKFPNAWIAAGLLCESQENYEQAVISYTKALDIFSAESEALRGLARSLLVLGQDQASKDAAERLAKSALIRERLKLLARNIDDQKAMKMLSDDLAFFERNHESFVWLVFASRGEESSPQTAAALQAKRQLANQESVDLGRLWKSLEPWQSRELKLDSLASNTSNPLNATLPTIAALEGAKIKFTDIGELIGADFDYNKGPLYDGGFNLYQTNGGGVAAIDYDLDGWIDMYLPQAGGKPLSPSDDRVNALYRNIDGAKAIDVHAQATIANASWGQGVSVGDFDADGFPDLLIACIGPTELWHNNGDGTFERWPMDYDAFDQESMTISAAIADINGDGLPDLVQANYADSRSVINKLCQGDDNHTRTCSPTEFISAPDRIYLNDGQGGFTVANQTWNLPIDGGRGLGVIVGNFDRQHGNDVYIANDMNANHFLISAPHATGSSQYILREEGAMRGLSVDGQGRAQASMGVATGDMNRDGILDIFVTNFYDEFNVVYLGKKGGMFVDATSRMGFANANKQTLGFGAQAADFDRDGYLDIAIVNGHVDDFTSEGKPFAMKPELYRGTSKGFVLVDNAELGAYFEQAMVGRVLALLDWDRDLKVDLVATHLDRKMALLHNETTTAGHVIQFAFVGTKCDRDATGTYVELTAGEDKWTASLIRGGGFECSNEAIVDLGVGSHTTIDEAKVTWPNGNIQTFKNLTTDQRYLIIEGQTEAHL